MAKQNLDIILGTRGTNAVVNDLNKARKAGDSFLKRMNKGIGGDSDFGKAIQLLRGAGIAAGVVGGLEIIARSAGQIRNEFNLIQAGSRNWQQSVDSIARQLPVMGQMLRIVDAINGRRTREQDDAALNRAGEVAGMDVRQTNADVLRGRRGDHLAQGQAAAAYRERTAANHAAIVAMERQIEVETDLQQRQLIGIQIEQRRRDDAQALADLQQQQAKIRRARDDANLKASDELMGMEAEAQARRLRLSGNGLDAELLQIRTAAEERVNAELLARRQAIENETGPGAADIEKQSIQRVALIRAAAIADEERTQREYADRRKDIDNEIMSSRLFLFEQEAELGNRSAQVQAKQITEYQKYASEIQRLDKIIRGEDSTQAQKQAAEQQRRAVLGRRNTAVERAGDIFEDRQFASFGDSRFGTGLAQSQREDRKVPIPIQQTADSTAETAELMRRLLATFEPVAKFLSSLQPG